MATTQELLVRAALQDRVSNGMRRIRGEVDATDRSVKRLSSAENNAAMKRLTDSTGNFADKVGGFVVGAAKRGALAVGALGAAATIFGLKSASSFEQSRISFDTLLGSTEKGGRLFAQLQQINVRTPFDLGQISQATQLLLRFGVSGDKVLPVLHGIIDAASLSGDPGANLSRIALAVGQISSQGRLLGQDARQLAEAGIEVYSVYAKRLGITVAQARKLGEQGKLDAKIILDAIANETDGLERFRGGAAALSGTLYGQFSNLKDKISYVLAGATSPLAGFLKDRIGDVNDYLDGVNDRIGKVGADGQYHLSRLSQTLGKQWRAGDMDGVAKSIDKIVGAGGKLEPVLDPALKILKDLGRIAKQDLVPLGEDLLKGFTVGLKALQPVVGYFADHPNEIRRGIEAVLLFVGLRKAVGAVSDLSKGLRDLRTVATDKGLLTALGRILGWNPGTVGPGLPTPTVPGGGPLPTGTPEPVGQPPVPGGGATARGIVAAALTWANFEAHKDEPAPSRVAHGIFPFMPGPGPSTKDKAAGIPQDPDTQMARLAWVLQHRKDVPGTSAWGEAHWVATGETPRAWKGDKDVPIFLPGASAPQTTIDTLNITLPDVSDPAGFMKALEKYLQGRRERG